jgi:hypothetical protein
MITDEGQESYSAFVHILTDGLGTHYWLYSSLGTLLNLKPLVCILIYTWSTWNIGKKYWHVLPQGFEYQICTLTIPTSSTINTKTKVVGRIKQMHDFLANNSG